MADAMGTRDARARGDAQAEGLGASGATAAGGTEGRRRRARDGARAEGLGASGATAAGGAASGEARGLAAMGERGAACGLAASGQARRRRRARAMDSAEAVARREIDANTSERAVIGEAPRGHAGTGSMGAARKRRIPPGGKMRTRTNACGRHAGRRKRRTEANAWSSGRPRRARAGTGSMGAARKRRIPQKKSATRARARQPTAGPHRRRPHLPRYAPALAQGNHPLRHRRPLQGRPRLRPRPRPLLLHRRLPLHPQRHRPRRAPLLRPRPHPSQATRGLRTLPPRRTLPLPGAELAAFRAAAACATHSDDLAAQDPGFERVMLRTDLRRALRALSPRQRFVLRERVLRRRILRDVAADLGCSYENVRLIERKALAILRRRLRGYENFSPRGSD